MPLLELDVVDQNVRHRFTWAADKGIHVVEFTWYEEF